MRVFSFSFFCVVLVVSAANADSIKLGGAWIDNVTIQNATGGSLAYTTATGNDVEKPLASVEGLKMSAYPDLEAAQKAVAAGKYADAVALEQKVLASVHQPWLHQWIEGQLVIALDKAGHAQEAVETYLQLIKDKAPVEMIVDRPPIASVTAANDQQKAAVARTLAGAPSEDDQVTAVLQKLVSLATVTAAAASGNGNGNGTPAAGTAVTPGTAAAPAAASAAQAATPDEEKSAVVLTNGLEPKDPIAAMLRKGDFQKALDAVNDELNKPTLKMASLLYERGVAQEGLADARKDMKLYKDAGLSFMRVGIYFTHSSFVGPSLVEAGRIHQIIGRPDIAAKLWEQAKLQIDEKDTRVQARLDELLASAGAEKK